MVDYRSLAYDELKRQGFAVFAAYKDADRWSNCIVTRKDFSGLPQKIRIAGSKWHQEYPAGWYKVSKAKLEESPGITYFWIFVLANTNAKVQRPESVFIVVPTHELVRRLKHYAKLGRSGAYNLYIAKDHPNHEGMVVDTRDQPTGETISPGSRRDYTSFAENWVLLKNAIGSC